MQKTDKLYYKDPYLKSFSANIVDQQEVDGFYRVLLDRTAFYPEGGGQPADKGTLNDIPVIKVEINDSLIYHYISSPLEDTRVSGQIDWAFRFSNMQQHTAQHVLSKIALEYGYNTVSFHIGTETVTIDLDTPNLSKEELKEIETRTNEILWSNLPISIDIYKEVPEGIRSKMEGHSDYIRVVSIADFDQSTCGGTHLSHTGQAGMLFISKQEKMRGNVRIHFLVGHKAYIYAKNNEDVLISLQAILTTGLEDLTPRVSTLLQDNKKLSKEILSLEEKLSSHILDELILKATQKDSLKLIRETVVYSPNLLEQILRGLQEKEDVLAIFSRDTGEIYAASSKNLQVDLGKALKESLTIHQGKGGGSKTSARGMIEPDKLDQVINLLLSSYGL